MKKLRTYIMLMLFLSMLVPVNLAMAQEDESPSEKKESRFSHKGIKFSLATTSMDMIAERGLAEGEGGTLGLGYGFSDRFTLWLNLMGTEHAPVDNPGVDFEFSGVEVNLQHKFNSESRWQPYGKLGGGVYGLQEKGTQETLVGAGINLGLGLDFFFSRHFGVGAEFTYKKLDYFSQSIETAEGSLWREISPNLNGDSVGFMLTFTIQ